MKTLKLMIPGPVDITDEVREAMAGPAMAHYGDDWVAIHRETIELLQRVFQTKNDLFLMVGSGTAGLDAALGSLLRTGEKVLIPFNGFFGRRLVAVARRYGLEVVPLRFPPGTPVDPDAVRSRLIAERDIKLVAMVHHETSTGMLNPVGEAAASASEQGVPIVVDTIASMGGVPIPVDEWGLDVVVTAANKCLESTPGLALISVSPRAWEMMGARSDRGHGWYLNLETWREYAVSWADWHPSPVTQPTQAILALRVSLQHILAEGLDDHYQRYARAADRVRGGLRGMGFELYLEEEHACPVITAFKARPEFRVSELVEFLRDRHGIMIAPGIGETRGQLFRIGHVGLAASDDYVESVLAGVKGFLRSKGLE